MFTGINSIPMVIFSSFVFPQVPNYTKWLEVSSKLYEFYMCSSDDVEDRKQITHFKSLQSALDLDMRFSEA